MVTHPCFSVLFIVDDCRTTTQPLMDYLQTIQSLQLDRHPLLPSNISHYDVVMVANPGGLSADEQTRLARYVETGGGCLGLVIGCEAALPDFYGVQPGPVGPEVELRVLFADADHPLATRLPDARYLPGRYQPLTITGDDVTTLLYADWRYEHSPVMVSRPIRRGRASCTSLTTFADPAYQPILYRLLRHLAGQPDANQMLGVGLLGYPPSVGQLHGQGAQAIDGLALRAACDLNPRRLDAARQTFPDIQTYDTAETLADDPAIDLVVIATPPNTHARLALQLLEAGKHVVCEKPLALTQAETEAMLVLAERQKLHLSCHQNRRWDADYLAIKRAVQEGLIGELFHLEAFVGSFNHPCGYWHSHDKISGGTTFDWGAHYLDWVLSLMPSPPTAVICTRHNRVWHDITNADQERIQLRFAGGQEADFIHSDIAAIPKPKWYLLGTEGAIVGHWQAVTVHTIDPVHYFDSHAIPPTEIPPQLTLQRRDASGRMVEQSLPLPKPPSYPFHRNLADHLLLGEPITVPGHESAQVVAVLEAAVRSAEHGGAVEELA
ncbi:MAG: Gfo/Idh/MocA family oxidoreductase [Anaerolineae bacterium]|nr:Gfo/Idh/MocA family oxidoreductase [Anaerolineae bacterium]